MVRCGRGRGLRSRGGRALGGRLDRALGGRIDEGRRGVVVRGLDVAGVALDGLFLDRGLGLDLLYVVTWNKTPIETVALQKWDTRG